ncbi:antifreeze protein type I [Clostridium sp. chh4-2]|uniref:SPFH domain-containing protein n=1 Tax=Clostridium sp. chh4-2 TaxID=2067550 RepID=UPI000CCE7168|nr:SPFH domain-containing protein [Clostridium sp. chh4-2]PNV60202.1 antifreeze protein type I [Clostridium sp. chh4-2]
MAKIANIIKYEGDNNTFIWKHPCEDFNTTTQLIVHESQEAIFFLNGKALDLFGPGRHTLETQNIPLLCRLINIPTEGESAFHCEVYFINKTEQMAIRWGTDSKVQYVEPTYKFPLSIGASGEMTLCVDDSRKLLVKLVGTERVLDRQQLMIYFRSILMTKVKTYIAQTMRINAINIFEIDENLDLFSEDIHTRLVPDFLDYGVKLKRFYVTTIVKPDGDPQYERFKELHFRQYADISEAKLRQQTDVIYAQTEAQKVVIDSQAQATKRMQEGYTYQQERGFDVAQDAAQNEAVGQFANMGIGLGMMAGVGGTVGGIVGGVVSEAFTGIEGVQFKSATNKFCDQCGAELTPGAAFCDECGAPQALPEICYKCGFKFIKPGKFCPKCGTKREGC